MAVIAPFRGLRYNPEMVKDLSLVMAPPYDVISPEGQRTFHARHHQNVIRLILGEVRNGDNAERNWYRRAGDYFRQWRAENVLIRDPTPAIYLYQQVFQVPGERELTRRGLIALIRLEGFGARTVFPHERTMAAAKEDRLRLMQSCHANLSPVFGIYPGPLAEVDRLFVTEEKRQPTIDLRDWDGIRHRVWTFDEPAGIEPIRRAFESIPIFIADGHHRYETALAYRDLVRARDRGDASVESMRPYDYIMMTLVSADDPGLVILPIHRLLRHLPCGDLNAYLAHVSRQFGVERMPFPPGPDAGAEAIVERLRVTGSGMHRFGLYAGGEKAYVLTLTDERIVEAEVAEGKPAAYKRLDVAILHALLIDGPLRRQGQDALPDDAFIYTHDAVKAIRMVQRGEWGAAFFLNPTKIKEVQAVASAGLRMPPKSTFFYPKLLTGLVIHPLVLDEVIEA